MNDSIYGAFQSKPRGFWHSEIWVMSYQLIAALHWNVRAKKKKKEMLLFRQIISTVSYTQSGFAEERK